MHRQVLLLLVLALLGGGCAARPVAPRTVALPPDARAAGLRRQVVSWFQDGVRRQYVEVVPPSAVPLPVVVVLHGRRQTPGRAERSEGWDAIAQQDHVLVAYGAGYAGSWNAGWCCGTAAARGLDDVAYVLQLLRRVEVRHQVDRHRVFLVGFSNGGMLAFRFACAHTRAVSALAVVDGALETATCRPQRPLAVLEISGDRDGIVPYAGSAYSRVAGAPTTSVPASLAPWRREDAGTPEPVELLRLARLGHDWPTWRDCGIDATPMIWRFLAAHPAATG